MQSQMNKKTIEGLGFNFNCAWEYEKHNALGTSVDTEKALFLFQRLVELEKSRTVQRQHIVLYRHSAKRKRMGLPIRAQSEPWILIWV